jgi:hypothetical protein
VTPNTEYAFSVWAKSPVQGQVADAYGYVSFFNSTGSLISGGWLGTYSNAGDVWAEVDFGTWVAPDGAHTVAYMFAGGDWSGWDGNNTNGVLLDDASVTLVPEPVTLSLLGLGALMLRRRK